MAEAGARTGREEKSHPQRGLSGDPRKRELQREGAAEPEVARQIHGPHPAAPELTLQNVAIAERAADRFQGDGGGHATNMPLPRKPGSPCCPTVLTSSARA